MARTHRKSHASAGISHPPSAGSARLPSDSGGSNMVGVVPPTRPPSSNSASLGSLVANCCSRLSPVQIQQSEHSGGTTVGLSIRHSEYTPIEHANDRQQRYRKAFLDWEKSEMSYRHEVYDNDRISVKAPPSHDDFFKQEFSVWLSNRRAECARNNGASPLMDADYVNDFVWELISADEDNPLKFPLWHNPFNEMAKQSRDPPWKSVGLLGLPPYEGANEVWRAALRAATYCTQYGEALANADRGYPSMCFPFPTLDTDAYRLSKILAIPKPQYSGNKSILVWIQRATDAYIRGVPLKKVGGMNSLPDEFDWSKRSARFHNPFPPVCLINDGTEMNLDSISVEGNDGDISPMNFDGGDKKIPADDLPSLSNPSGSCLVLDGLPLDNLQLPANDGVARLPALMDNAISNDTPINLTMAQGDASGTVDLTTDLSASRFTELSSRKSHPCAPIAEMFEGTPRSAGRAGQSNVRLNRNTTPSKPQMWRLVSKAIPHPHDKEFVKQMMSYHSGANTICHNDPINIDDTIGGTDIQWLEMSFREATSWGRDEDMYSEVVEIDFEKANPFAHSLKLPKPGEVPSMTEFQLLEVILNRRVNSIKKVKDPVMDAAQVRHVLARNKEELADEYDDNYKAYLVVCPQAGLFYSNRELYPAGTGGMANHRGHIGIGVSWLRLNRQGFPARGSYIKKLVRGYTFQSFDCHHFPVAKVLEGKEDPYQPIFTRIYSAIQLSDREGPALSPDVFEGEDVSNLGVAELKSKYRERLEATKSRKIGGRHFVAGAHHHKLNSNVLIIDPRVDGNADIIVGVHEGYVSFDDGDGEGVDTFTEKDGSSYGIYNRTRIQETTTLEIRNLDFPENEATLNALNVTAFEATVAAVKYSGLNGSCRNGQGDHGVMIPMGTGVHDFLSAEEWNYRANVTTTNLPEAADAAARLGKAYFPTVLRAMQESEVDVGIREPSAFFYSSEETGYYTCHRCEDTTLDVEEILPHIRHPSFLVNSCNLMNASHFDPGDGNEGYIIFHCKHGMDGVSNWYFLFPNLIGKREDGTIFQGVAIKLYHGVGIAFDGRVLRHCTSITEGVCIPHKDKAGVTPHVFGTYSGTKLAHIERSRKQTLEAYKERLKQLDKTPQKSNLPKRTHELTNGPIGSESKEVTKFKTRRGPRRKRQKQSNCK